MSESIGSDEVVTIAGGEYSRALAEQIAQDIERAHRNNSQSWILYRSASGALVLTVESIVVMSVRSRDSDLILLGTPNEDRFREIRADWIRTPYKIIDAIQLTNVPTADALQFLEHFGDDHSNAIDDLAVRVKTRPQRANEHQSDVVEALSAIVGRDLPQPGYLDSIRSASDSEDVESSTVRYWKISPGGGAGHWNSFRDRSLVAVRFSDYLVDMSSYSDDEQAFIAMAQSGLEVSRADGKCLWQFSKQMKIGDRILAYGNRTVLGYGTVVSDYQMVDDDFNFMHRRSVVWDSLVPRQTSDLPQPLRNKLSRRSTLFELTAEEFAYATAESDQQAAAFAIDQLDPYLLEYLADDIERAHAINPRSWALGLIGQGQLSLYLRNINALITASELGAHHGGFSVLGLPEDAELSALPGTTSVQIKDVGVSWYRLAPEESLEVMLDTLGKAHRSAIDAAASSVRTRTSMARLHRALLVDRLASVVGGDLPQPAYLDELGNPGESSLLEHVEGRRYWRMEAGGAGKYWNAFRDLGVVAYDNWSSEPVHLDHLSSEYNAFVAEIVNYPGIAKSAANHCWNFCYGIGIGDLVVVEAQNTAYGWGEVTGEYEYLEDEQVPPHRRTIDWHELLPAYQWQSPSADLKSAARQYGPSELSFAQFLEAIGEQIPEGRTEPVAALADVAGFLGQQFAASGLHYSDQQVAAFYTALQTKGFVVLSGISGTGKSKIATGFVDMLPSPPVSQSNTQDSTDDTLIRIAVSRTTQNSGLVNFPIKQIESFPAPAAGERLRVPVSFDGITQDCLLHHMADRGSLYRLYFSGELRKRIVDLPLGTTLHFKTKVDDVDLVISGFDIFLDAPETKEQAAPVPTGKSGNLHHLFLSVRPDWRDSTSLLGYYNPLTETYEWTDFLKFIIQASQNYQGPAEDRVAWFVILDEMNLAHVEYYFADLLSVLESGRDDEGWTREPLRLSYPDLVDDDVPDRELRLPPNLYIIGTVNMDETTHAFSPKVLDRAFTIELADVDFTNYPPPTATPDSGKLSDAEQRGLLAAFSRKGRFVRIDKVEIADYVERYPRVRDDLQALNEVLTPFRMHFGYRVFDEIVQYLIIKDENGMPSRNEALDEAVFMKVLPKFSGSRARLLSPLQGVLGWADPSGGVPGVEIGGNPSHATWETSPAFPRVAARVRAMLLTLESDGFVSFG